MAYSLTNNEYTALQDITRINGMDCWFCLKQNKHGEDYIYDLEERKRLSITKALEYICEGLFYEDLFLLPNEEQEALEKMVRRYLKEDLLKENKYD